MFPICHKSFLFELMYSISPLEEAQAQVPKAVCYDDEDIHQSLLDS